VKILVIDDEVNITKALKRGLTGKGHEVTILDDGLAGMEYLTESHENYDLVLCDVRMPKLDGISMIQKLRDNAIDIPVVIMSGHIESGVLNTVAGLGNYNLLPKPFTFKSLLSLIERV